jgi:ketosteroid isomerase-like protein
MNFDVTNKTAFATGGSEGIAKAVAAPVTGLEMTENEILDLSMEKFRWKTTRNVDAVADLFDDEIVFVHLNGYISSKEEWIGQMRSGQFVYNAIDVEETPSVKVYGDAAALVGKAVFTVTIGGFKGTFNLVYTEVYAKKKGKWKLVNLHTCSY